MGSEIAVLSPHFDDAVLSCWHVLSGPTEVEVVNVFTGAPAEGRPAAWWDRATGASDSVERMRERLEEDRNALAVAGRRSVELGLLENQYRSNGEVPAVTGRLREAVRPGSIVYAPAALGLHPDHTLVRDAALDLARDGFEVRLYADFPHATFFGWPAWVTGAERDPHMDVDALWEPHLRPLGSPSPEAHALDDHTYDRKLEAVEAYRTQLSALRRESPLEEMRYEVVWTLGEVA